MSVDPDREPPAEPASGTAWAGSAPWPLGPSRGLALGFVAMLPLVLAYEWGLAATGGGSRNTSELVLFRVFEVFGARADLARWVGLGLAAAWALATALRADWKLGPRLGRILVEGALGALVIGPLLIGCVHLLGDALPALDLAPPRGAPPLERAALVFGAGAYEELVFRVGVYSALFWMSRRGARFLGAGERASRLLADAVGLSGSAGLFAAFHLAILLTWLGRGGEDFDPAIFTYRFLAGILLGLLFRLRGPGVAAWTHGLFNLALLLGAGPHVFL